MVKRNKSGRQSGQFKSANVKKHKQFLKNAKSNNASTNPNRVLPEKQQKSGYMRDKSKIKLLNLYNDKPDIEKMKKEPSLPVRIQPDRKWFGNVRTIGQKNLEELRVEMQKQNQNMGNKQPNQYVIKKNKLPIELLIEKQQSEQQQMKILEVESYKDTFGPKSKRKRVKLSNVMDYEQMNEKSEQQINSYKVEKDSDLVKGHIEKDAQKDKRLEAGQSKRIWEELYKVLDSSDVICQVIDARDPMGTRCKHIEEHIKKNLAHKHLVLIMNKVDLIPTWLTKRWIACLQKEYPTIAYHASVQHSYGKGGLLNLLRQFDNFHKEKKNISVGFIGYPNVGKSSVINSLKQKKVCKAAPIPGETKVWQYVHLTKRIYLIDCPGIVYNYEGKDDVTVVLKGVVRAERLEDPEIYIPYILEKAQKKDLMKIYNIKQEWNDSDEFLNTIARQKGKLLKGGEPDIKTVSKIVILDWQRGEIPYQNYPPDYVENKQQIDEELDQDEQIDQEFEKELLDE